MHCIDQQDKHDGLQLALLGLQSLSAILESLSEFLPSASPSASAAAAAANTAGDADDDGDGKQPLGVSTDAVKRLSSGGADGSLAASSPLGSSFSAAATAAAAAAGADEASGDHKPPETAELRAMRPSVGARFDEQQQLKVSRALRQVARSPVFVVFCRFRALSSLREGHL